MILLLQSLEMIENIRDEFIDLVEQSTWMDEVSKEKAIEKVNEHEIIMKYFYKLQAHAINEKIGYPDFLDGDNMTQLENEYTEVFPNNEGLLDLFFSLLEYLRYIVYAKSIAHASAQYKTYSSISSSTD